MVMFVDSLSHASRLVCQLHGAGKIIDTLYTANIEYGMYNNYYIVFFVHSYTSH